MAVRNRVQPPPIDFTPDDTGIDWDKHWGSFQGPRPDALAKELQAKEEAATRFTYRGFDLVRSEFGHWSVLNAPAGSKLEGSFTSKDGLKQAIDKHLESKAS